MINQNLDKINSKRTKEDDKKYLLHSWSVQDHYNPTYISKAEGIYFWDENGKKYMDFCSQLVNCNAGHQHPKIISSIKKQTNELSYIGPAFTIDIRAKLGKKLSEIIPGSLSTSFFSDSGARANEIAIILAKTLTGKNKIIARKNSYHGATLGAASVSGDIRRVMINAEGYETVFIDDPHSYDLSIGNEKSVDIKPFIDQLLSTINKEDPNKIAAIIMETISGSNLRIVPPKGYYEAVKDICEKYNIILILDEVMTGFGRTGKWFGFSHWDMEPDILTLAKGLTSGTMPLGATVVSDQIAGHYQNHYLPTGLTNFAHPIGCAAALASIEVYESEGLIDNSKKMGKLLKKELKKLSSKHKSIGSFRGKGLFYAIEFVDIHNPKKRLVEWDNSNYYKAHPLMKKLIQLLKSKGLYTYSRFNVLFIAPPLCITKNELLNALDMISESITDSIENG